LNQKEPIELLIRVLVNGGRVEQNGTTYAMAEDGSMCVVLDEKLGMRIPMTLKEVCKLANDIGKDELWLNCCELQL